MQVNYLVLFLFMNLLLFVLLWVGGVVINILSVVYCLFGYIDVDDFDNVCCFSLNKVYGDVKFVNVLFIESLYERFYVQGFSVVVFYFGSVQINFVLDFLSIMCFVYWILLCCLLLIGLDKGGVILWWFIEGILGEIWILGVYYDECVFILCVNLQVYDVVFVGVFWQCSVEFVGILMFQFLCFLYFGWVYGFLLSVWFFYVEKLCICQDFVYLYQGEGYGWGLEGEVGGVDDVSVFGGESCVGDVGFYVGGVQQCG